MVFHLVEFPTAARPRNAFQSQRLRSEQSRERECTAWFEENGRHIADFDDPLLTIQQVILVMTDAAAIFWCMRKGVTAQRMTFIDNSPETALVLRRDPIANDEKDCACPVVLQQVENFTSKFDVRFVFKREEY